MSYNFLAYEQDQLFLMPPSLTEWVGEESLARFVSDVVDTLETEGELRPFYAHYRSDGWGRAAYHPRMMVKVLLYGYSVGVRSSRKLAAALEESVPFRYLAANQQPDFRTISDFRKEHLEALEALFVDVLRLCEEAGLVKLGRVALDGRKVAASAALDQNRKREGLEREIRRIFEEAERLDAEEEEAHGADRRGDELPRGLATKADRLRRLKEARARLVAEEEEAKAAQAEKIREREEEERRTGKKKRGRKPKPPEAVVDREKKANVTDPDSRIMKTRRGWVQGYNAQAMADCESQVIVAQDVTEEENDVGQLGPMLERCEAQAGRRPDACLADAGYWSEENAALEDDRTELFVATTKEWKQRKAQREQGAPRGRMPKSLGDKERMERKLRTKRGRAAYKERASTIEPVFGQMEGRGLNRFLLRGKRKAAGEWSLFCTTHNLLKLWRSGWRVAPTKVAVARSGAGAGALAGAG
ncbi:MAG TPA: IS1182 family transposase [Longimicrobiales bacterium]|nr:IS1182 family transposase [Longimicrobiales bacterium]